MHNRKSNSPHWLRERLGRVLWHKYMTGKSLVCWMLGNETKIPAEREEKTDKYECLIKTFRVEITFICWILNSDCLQCLSIKLTLRSHVYMLISSGMIRNCLVLALAEMMADSMLLVIQRSLIKKCVWTG